MHRTKGGIRPALWLTVGFLLAALITGLFLYLRLQTRTHDLSGVVLVNVMETLRMQP